MKDGQHQASRGHQMVKQREARLKKPGEQQLKRHKILDFSHGPMQPKWQNKRDRGRGLVDGTIPLKEREVSQVSKTKPTKLFYFIRDYNTNIY